MGPTISIQNYNSLSSYSNRGLDKFPPELTKVKNSKETYLDVSFNRLSELPNLSNGFPLLLQLNLSQNRYTCIPQNAALLPKLKKLV